MAVFEAREQKNRSSLMFRETQKKERRKSNVPSRWFRGPGPAVTPGRSVSSDANGPLPR
jgi:hypothetical protein